MHSGLDISVRQLHAVEMLEMLVAGELDCARPPILPGRTAGLRVFPLDTVPLVVACPVDHPLASAAEVALADLAGESFVETPSGSRPGSRSMPRSPRPVRSGGSPVRSRVNGAFGDRYCRLVAGKKSIDPADAVRWLDADEERAWVAFTGVLLRLPAALDADMRQHSGITHFEYLVLSAISEAPGRTLPMGELAALSYASPSRVSHVVTRLEKRRWITRSPAPDNRRVVNAQLTPEGLDVLRAAAPRHVATVRHLVFDAISREQTVELSRISHDLLPRLDPHDDWPPRSTRVRP